MNPASYFFIFQKDTPFVLLQSSCADSCAWACIFFLFFLSFRSYRSKGQFTVSKLVRLTVEMENAN